MKRFAIAAAVLMGGCAVGPEFLSYEEFKAQAQVEEETGIYIVNGDEIVVDETEMVDMYERYRDSAIEAYERDGYSTTEQFLIVNRVGGKDDRWPQATASNLTYCIDTQSFGTRYSAMVTAMNSATGACRRPKNRLPRSAPS